MPEQQQVMQGLGLESVQELWPGVSPDWSLDQQPSPEHSQGRHRGCASYLGGGHGELLAAVTPTLQQPPLGSLTAPERHRHGSHSRICYRMWLGELVRQTMKILEWEEIQAPEVVAPVAQIVRWCLPSAHCLPPAGTCRQFVARVHGPCSPPGG